MIQGFIQDPRNEILPGSRKFADAPIKYKIGHLGAFSRAEAQSRRARIFGWMKA